MNDPLLRVPWSMVTDHLARVWDQRHVHVVHEPISAPARAQFEETEEWRRYLGAQLVRKLSADVREHSLMVLHIEGPQWADGDERLDQLGNPFRQYWYEVRALVVPAMQIDDQLAEMRTRLGHRA